MAADLGTFRRVDPSVLDDDPFWSVVRRRHPDLDIVVLPPDEPSDPPAPDQLSAAGAVRAAADDAAATWQLLRSLLDTTGAPEAALPPTVRGRRHGPGHVVVLQKGVRSLGQDRGTDLLREVTLALGRAGWRLRPAAQGDHPVLDATNGLSHVHAEAGPGATVLSVSSAPLLLTEETAASLVDEIREAVSSWQ